MCVIHFGSCTGAAGFTTVAVITLALGIGVTTANRLSGKPAFFLKALPYAQENELVSVCVVAPVSIDGEFLFANVRYSPDWREHQDMRISPVSLRRPEWVTAMCHRKCHPP